MSARFRWLIIFSLVYSMTWGAPARASQLPDPGEPPVKSVPGVTPEAPPVKPPVEPGAPPPTAGTPAPADAKPQRPETLVVGLNGLAGGISAAITKRDNNLYVGMGPRLAVINVTNPATPTLIGRSTVVMTSTVRWLQSAPGFVYVTDAKLLYTFDMSTPSLPTLVGSTPLPGDIQGAVYSPTATQKWVWVANGAVGGVTAINVTTPGNPVRNNSYNSPGQALGLTRSNNFLYLADGTSGIRIVDVTNPSSPSGRAGAGVLETNASYRSVAVYGDKLYVGSSLGRLRIYDVSPTNASSAPVPRGYIDVATSGIYGIHIVVQGGTRKAYLAADTAGLIAVDVTNPDAPTLIGAQNTPGRALGVWVASNIAYVADWYGVRALDVSTPSLPQVSVLPEPGRARDVAVSADGNYFYTADFDFGVRIASLSNLAAPQIVGSYNQVTTVVDVYAEGNYVYAAGEASGLHIINVTNPAVPTQCGTFTATGARIEGVWKSGIYAYLVDALGYLRIINVNACSNPFQVGQTSVPGASGVVVNGIYAYVATGVGGMSIVDVSNPTFPVVRSSFDPSPSGFGLKIAYQNNYVYLADDLQGIHKINVTDPTSPTLEASILVAGAAQDIAVLDDLVYVAVGGGGMQIFDVATFRVQGAADTGGQGYGVTAMLNGNGKRVFLSDDTGGVAIYQVSGVPLYGLLLLPVVRR